MRLTKRAGALEAQIRSPDARLNMAALSDDDDPMFTETSAHHP